MVGGRRERTGDHLARSEPRHRGAVKRGWHIAICVVFLVWVCIEHFFAWSPRSDRALTIGLALGIFAQAIVAAARRPVPRQAAAAALGWSVVLGVILLSVWLSPSPGRTAFCSAPQAMCEHGMLVFVYAVLTLVLAVVAAILAGGGSWFRTRRRPS